MTRGCSRRRSSGRSRRSSASTTRRPAIAAANDTEYGLVAYVYTSDLKRAFRVCEKLETGMIGLNQGIVSNAAAPFGGVKASGFGREGGAEGIARVPRDQVRRDGDVSEPRGLRSRGSSPRVVRGGGRGRPRRAELDGARDGVADGVPSVRIVLLKGIDDRGIRFFTNYDSRKGRELDANPRAAVALYWQPLHRQVRMEGAVERLGAEESDAYFATRDRGSRLGAWASQQGTVIPGARDARDRAPRRRRARTPTTCRARTTGAATAWSPTRSSSGRAARTGSTTASTSSATPTEVGAPSICLRDDFTAG